MKLHKYSVLMIIGYAMSRTIPLNSSECKVVQSAEKR
jgi:hypothetical protein